MAISGQIVTVAATVTAAPAPSTYQQSGAAVSVGGTTLTTNSYGYYGSAAAALAVLSSSGNFAELTTMINTFFAQQGPGNTVVGLYILELGAQGVVSAGITALGTWIAANPNIFYAYLTPASWDASGSALNTLAANYSNPTSKTYFFVTTTISTFSVYLSSTKAILWLVASPTAANSEFQMAVPFFNWLVNNPSAANPAVPMQYRFAYGVTPWAWANNQTSISTILTAGGNVIVPASEGGLTEAMLENGTTADGQQSMFWYDVDWLQIQAKQRLAAAIINGSNNPQLRVPYNQFGINALLAILTGIGSQAIAAGLLLGVSFAAVPFAVYTAENPSNYAAGIYQGFSCITTPQLGFISIEFFIDALQFAA